jgi:hypothetical protein
VSINYESDKSYINKFIDSMPAFDAKFLRRMYNNVTPSVNNRQEFNCIHCGESQEVEVPLTVGFFWPE